MDEFLPVSPIPGSMAFDLLRHSPVDSNSPGPAEFTERSGSYLTSLINSGSEMEFSPSLSPEEQKYNPSSEPMVSPVSFVNQDQSAGMMYQLPSLDSNLAFNSEKTNCELCGALISANQDAIMSHLQRCCSDDQLTETNTKKIDNLVDIKPAAVTITYNGDEQLVQIKWEKYMRTLQVKMAPDYNFSSKSYTFDVPGLDPGMKLEAVDKNNPQSFCVATVVEVAGQRVKIRYDGFGRDDSNDFWCNFQAEELYPIGWCAQNAFPLQPPTGINCTLEEWRKFLTKTLTGALAAPKQLFPLEHFQPKVHAFEIGMKLEIIHPLKPYVICAATVVKSLGPYYFLVATDTLDDVPAVTMCCHSDSSTIFPPGWSYKHGIEFTVPSGYTRKIFSWEKYVASCRGVFTPQHLFKKFKAHKFRTGQKLEAVDLEQPHLIRVATIANVMGRVLQLFFDGSQTRFQFVECDSPDIHGFGWCKRTAHPLITPYGKMPFRTVTKYEGSESCQKQLKLISFADVIGRNPTPPNIPTSSNLATTPNSAASTNLATPNLTTPNLVTYNLSTHSNLATPSNIALPSNLAIPNFETPSMVATHNLATSSDIVLPNFATTTTPTIATSTSIAAQPCQFTSVPGLSSQDKPVLCPMAEVVDNNEDRNEKIPPLSPSDDDEDISDEEGSATGSERFYHNKNQIYFNKTCCCGPMLTPEEVKLLPDATEPGKVSTVIRIGLEMVAKCAKDPARVLEMMQEGSGVRLTIKYKGQTFKKAISRVDSRPKLVRYLKRFCRRLVCCEYFLSLTPVVNQCPDDCKADQYGNLQGPKGMKAKRAREYFETKHLGYEKKKRGRKTKAVANEAAAQRAAAGIVTSVFHKGNHVPLPNLNLPVVAIAHHLRNTATKILHQVQASQGLTERSIQLRPKPIQPNPTTMVSQTSAAPPHPTTPYTTMPTSATHHPTSSVVPPASPTLPTPPVSTAVPAYGKPRLLPSPYGAPPLPVPTTTAAVTSGTTTTNGRSSLYTRSYTRAPKPPPKKIIRSIVPAGPLPERKVPLGEVPFHIPSANKLPLPPRSSTIPAVTSLTVTLSNTRTSSAKPVFRLAPPKFMAHPQSSNGKTATTFSNRLVAVPQSLATSGNYALSPNPPNISGHTTTLVTANQHPIPASISLTRSGPPPLIPARAISGTPTNLKVPQNVQILRPRFVEGKVVAPNVCVTEHGTFVAAQLNKTSVSSSGACPVNHLVGQSADANAMMNKMFSVVRENGGPVPIAPAGGMANVRSQPTQVARILPSVKPNVHDNSMNNSGQNTSRPNQNTNMPNSNPNMPNQNTNMLYQNTSRFDSNTNLTSNSTVKYDKNANNCSQNTGRAKKLFLNVGGMGAVTTAVRSGMLARENYKAPDGSRDAKITERGGYSVKINENNLETNSVRSTVTNLLDRTAQQSDVAANISDRTQNQSFIAPNLSDVTPTASDLNSMVYNVTPNEQEVDETKADTAVVTKRGSTWLFRRRKKKRVRFTYVKGKNKKKKEEEEGEGLEPKQDEEFMQEYQDSNEECEQRRGKSIKRDYQGDVDDKNDPPYAPPHATEISPKRAKRSSDFTNFEAPAHVSTVASPTGITSSYVTSPKAELMKGVLHAVQSSQHPSVKLRNSPNGKQLHSLNGFSSPPKRSRVHSTESPTSRKQRIGAKSSILREKINASTNTSLPGCHGDMCLYHPDNPRLWSIEQVGEFINATDCKNYATYFMDQEIDGESLLMLTRGTLMQFTNMKLGPTLKLSNYIAQLRARVGMSKHT